MIGSDGGIIEVTDPSSLLFGVKVEIPKGALNTKTNVTIDISDINPSYNINSEVSSSIIELEATNVSFFEKPVLVTVPYDDNSIYDNRYIGLFHYNKSNDTWDSTTTINIDTINHTITAATMHFSLFQVLSAKEDAIIFADYDTHFKPYVNGFKIFNAGDDCFGISAYSKWFFENSNSELYDYYDDNTAWLIADESQNNCFTVFGCLRDIGIAATKPYFDICNAIINTGKPQVIGMNSPSLIDGHAVVAYKIIDGNVYIYDPNYPSKISNLHDEIKLVPNGSGSFNEYSGYTHYLLFDYSIKNKYLKQIYDYYPQTGGTFSINTVDISGEVGLYNSIALDNNENPHISYLDLSNIVVKHARLSGISWSIKTVAYRGSNLMADTSIAIDSAGKPHITYCDGNHTELKYAKWTGSSWSISNVASGGVINSLLLDNYDNPIICFDNVMYAQWLNESWSIDTVEDGSSAPYSDNSVALDSNGNPHISYYYNDGSNEYLRYARLKNNTWYISNIAGSAWYSSIAIDPNDNPHISYIDQTDGMCLKYARWTGTQWLIMTLDTSASYAPTSIALESHGNPHIIYQRGSNLMYARWKGNGWSIRTVDNGGEFSSIALSGSGNPHISYIQKSILKYAKYIP